MNFGIKILVLLVFTYISLGKLYSQNNSGFSRGFIINNSGDTIDGYISDQYNESLVYSCLFKPTKSDHPTYLQPLEIKQFAFYKANKNFISSSIPKGTGDTTAFVRLLFDGTYDLLYYCQLNRYKHFLIRSPDSTITDISYPAFLTNEEYLAGMTSRKKYKQQINSFCRALSIKEGSSEGPKPKINSFIKYLENYQRASGEPYIIHYGIQRDFYSGFVTGVTFDRYLLKIPTKSFQSFPEASPYAGIYLRLMRKNAVSGILFQSSLGYKRYHYSYLTENNTSNEYYETFVKSLASISKIGLSVNLRSPALFKPYFECGGLLTVYINPKYDNYRDLLSISDNTAYSYHDQNELNSDPLYGAFIRMGIQMDLENNNIFKISGGYDFLTNSDANVHSLDFSLIYMMKFK